MRCCNENDILFTTEHNELYVRKYVGMEGYFANSIEELMKKIQNDSFISKIKDTVIVPSDIPFSYKNVTKVISENGKERYCIFLPKDKVFEFNQFMVSSAFEKRFKLVKYLI